MNWKHIVKDYLTFSKKDRIGAISIICLILIIWLLPKLFTKNSTTPFIKDDPTLQAAIDTLQQRAQHNNYQSYERNNPSNYQYESSQSAGFWLR